MLFICYPKCSTCKKAENWLKENGLTYEKRDIAADNPTENELKAWLGKSGVDSKKLFNTSGLSYRRLELKDKMSSISTDERISLLASDGMLVKRPILVYEQGVFFGFNEKLWAQTLL